MVLLCDEERFKKKRQGCSLHVKRHHDGDERASQSDWQAANVDATVFLL